MKIKFIRKIKQRIHDILNVCSVAGIRNLYAMAILPHFGSKATRIVRRERKQQAILHFLRTEYKDIILKYRQEREVISQSSQAPIWVCWWQGKETMPPIVQACFRSLCIHAGNHPVHLITQKNISEYTAIPNYILQKVQDGKISFTHFSDILRMCLLYEHGGLWTDATVYVSQPIPEEVFQKPLFTIASHIDTDNISQGRWTGFILGSCPKGILCSFTREVFFQYWKRKNRLLDYFLIDYIIATAYNNLLSVNQSLNSIPTSHTRLFDMENMLNLSYNEKEFSSLCQQQIFHKLSYKHTHFSHTIEGKITLYEKLTNHSFQYYSA